MATIEEHLEAAKAAIISGACDRALVLCQRVLAHYPKHLEAHSLLAEAYRERGDSAIAEDIFVRVLSADPGSLIARWALSVLLEQRGDGAAALAQLRIALEASPDHSELRNEVVRRGGDRAKPSQPGLAFLYLRGGLFDLAAAEFRTALELEPQRLDLQIGLAESLWRGARRDEAAAQCRRILEESPDCLKATIIAALAETARGKHPSESETGLWRSAYAIDPEGRLAEDLAAAAGIQIPSDRRALLPGPVELPDIPAAVPQPARAHALAMRPAPVASPSDAPPSPSDASHWATSGLADSGVEDNLAVPITASPGGAMAPSEGDTTPVAASHEDITLPYEPELDDLARLMDEEWHEAHPEPAVDDRRASDELTVPPIEGSEVAPRPAGGDSLVDAPMAEHVEDVAQLEPDRQSKIARLIEEEQRESPPQLPPDWMPEDVASASEGVVPGAHGGKHHGAALSSVPGMADSGQSPTAPAGGQDMESGDWGEWADLLNEEITLDPESEARLAAALGELPGPQSSPTPVSTTAGTPAAGPVDQPQAPVAHGRAARTLPADLQDSLNAVEADPGDHKARLALAAGYQQVGMLDEAVAQYGILLKASASFSGDISKRLRDLLRADPRHADAHRALGDAYMKMGRFQQAIDEYSQALQLKVDR